MHIGRDITISPSVISIRRLSPERRRRNDVAKRGRLYTSFHFHFPQWTAALLRVIPAAVVSDARVGGCPGKTGGQAAHDLTRLAGGRPLSRLADGPRGTNTKAR